MKTKTNKGSIFWRISSKFQFAAEKIIPDPLVFCLLLTIVLFICGIIFTKNSPIQLLQFWYDGFWSQIGFAFQMSFMVITCAVTARSKAVQNLLSVLANMIKTPTAAIIVLMIFGYASSFINWAFCTIATPVLATLLAKRIKGLHFPMMIAAGYSTMILGQCLGPSASAYALVATPDHFLAGKIGIITQDVSVYNPVNVTMFCILAIVTIVVTILTIPPKDQVVEYSTSLDEISKELKTDKEKTFANTMNNSKVLMYLLGLAGAVMIIYTVATQGFLKSLSLNFVIFFFMTLNCFIYNSPSKFISAYRDNMPLATDVMIQFPFYGGIAGLMSNSGLGQILVGGMISVANAKTLPVLSYWSASILNLFIPSQGGQIIVQGDILMDAALAVKAEVPHVLNAFVYGDEATNLLQPLYVIPALAVVGMKLKDVWGFMAFIWFIWFVLTTIGLYIIPMLV